MGSGRGRAAAANSQRCRPNRVGGFGPLDLDLELEPESAGVFAESFAVSHGLLRDLEDATPTPFGPPPRGHEGGQVPTVGWGRAPHPHDFLGSEFLLDLWCRAERAEDEVEAAITEALDMRAPGKRVAIKGCVPTLQLARQRHAGG